MLFAGEDIDDFDSQLRGGDESFKMVNVLGGSAGGSGSYRPLSYPSPTTPWDSSIGDLRSSMEVLHYPSRAPHTEAMQYMSQYLMRARGSEIGSMFHEGVWPPPGEGATLVDPILRSSSQVDLTGIADSVIREDNSTHGFNGGGSHSRNVSGNSQAPLLPPGITSSPTPPSLTLVNPSGPHTATPTRSSPLKDAVVGTSSGDHELQEEDKLMRNKKWIKRSLAR
jgi:hypothetical protein